MPPKSSSSASIALKPEDAGLIELFKIIRELESKNTNMDHKIIELEKTVERLRTKPLALKTMCVTCGEVPFAEHRCITCRKRLCPECAWSCYTCKLSWCNSHKPEFFRCGDAEPSDLTERHWNCGDCAEKWDECPCLKPHDKKIEF